MQESRVKKSRYGSYPNPIKSYRPGTPKPTPNFQTHIKSYPFPKIKVRSEPIGFRIVFRDRTWIRLGPAYSAKVGCVRVSGWGRGRGRGGRRAAGRAGAGAAGEGQAQVGIGKSPSVAMLEVSNNSSSVRLMISIYVWH